MSMLIRKHNFIFFTFLFTLIIILFTIIVTNNQKKTYRSKAQETITPTPEASPSAQIALLETVIESDNIKTNELLNNYEQSTHEEEKQSIVSNLETHLTQRQQDQLSLLALSPLSVYNKAFSKEMIERLKKISSDQNKEFKIEKYLDTITGTVNTTIYDNFDDNTSYTTATFIPDDNEAEINFYPTDNQTFLSGTKVTLNNAVRIDEGEKVLGVSSVYAQEQPPQEKETPQTHLISVDIQTIETPPLDTLGEQKILVLLACLENLDCSQLPTPQEIEQRINNEINQFFKRDSYNNMSLVANTTDKWSKINNQDAIEGGDEKVLSEFAHDIELKGYDRLAIILVTEDNGLKGEGGWSSLGKGYQMKIADKTTNFSLFTIFASLKKDYFFSTDYHTEDGDMSHFDKVFSHELIHSLGGQHARSSNILGNNFTSIDALGRLEEYGNHFEIMGRPIFGLYSNAYIKKEFKWIGQNTEGNIIKIDISNPEGEYTLKKMGSTGQVAVWLPYSSRTDYFLEYRKATQQSGLVINFLDKQFLPYDEIVSRTILFPATRSYRVLEQYYKKNEIFFDQAHRIKIAVKDINDSSDTLTLTINRCQKNRPPNIPLFHLISDRAGNGNISSINVFEDDLRNVKPFQQQFFIENILDCAISHYAISPEFNIEQGNIFIKPPNFRTVDQTYMMLFPYDVQESSFTIFGNIGNPKLPNTTIKITVDKFDMPYQSNSLMYVLNLVPSPDEYKNDLEPHMINIKDKDINNKEFNHLETKKEQTLIFTSNIANNSRKVENENPSSNFRMIWYIQNDKGNNVIPPFNQPHAGIPPKTLDDANPAQLTWTIPQNLPVGIYKTILEVDSNNRLQEFNENNNMIWRYFNVVE